MIMLQTAIRVIHYILLIFAIFTPLLNPTTFTNEFLLNLHVVVMPGIIIHWITNNNVCSLTLLESYVTNKPMDQTFIASVLHPFFQINDNLIYTMAVGLWLTSIYKLYNSQTGFRLLRLGVQIPWKIITNTPILPSDLPDIKAN